MASRRFVSAGGVLEEETGSDDDDDDAERLDNGPTMTSQYGGGRRPFPVEAARGGFRPRRVAVAQYVGGGKQAAISVVEEERSTEDDDQPSDDELHSKTGTGSGPSRADSQFVVDYPQGVRMRYPRTSLLGRPLGFRPSRRDTRLKRLQSRAYNFLERPKTCPAIVYHIAV